MIILALLCLFHAPGVAQEHLSYQMNTSVLLTECDLNGKVIGRVLIPASSKFNKVAVLSEDTCIIKIWTPRSRRNDRRIALVSDSLRLHGKSNEGSPYGQRILNVNYRVNNGDVEVRYYRISENELDRWAKPLAARFEPTYGTMTFPLKYRPQRGKVTKDLTLSGLGGIQFNTPTRSLSVSLMAGVGISAVTVDSAGTDANILDAREVGAVTLPVGLVLQWQRLQVGLMMGWDWLLTGNEEKWIYHGRHWLSAGIGISLFQPDGQEGDREELR